MGKLHLEPTNAIALGLSSLETTKLKLISSYLLSKPTSPTEAALTYLKIPIIKRSNVVYTIDSTPSSNKQSIISRYIKKKQHSIDLYSGKPFELEFETFKSFWKNYSVHKTL